MATGGEAAAATTTAAAGTGTGTEVAETAETEGEEIVAGGVGVALGLVLPHASTIISTTDSNSKVGNNDADDIDGSLTAPENGEDDGACDVRAGEPRGATFTQMDEGICNSSRMGTSVGAMDEWTRGDASGVTASGVMSPASRWLFVLLLCTSGCCFLEAGGASDIVMEAKEEVSRRVETSGGGG